ncbi:MAG: 50S ribosomal protein L25 [Anaerolineales bacterium]|nr:50S ribosomal protein L25 [Anaerolineales bacterium]MDW8161044.1 50S ribosomal protein L25 [Anaerolineales bacterium]
MENVVLEAAKREVVGKKVKALRRAGKLPAVVYGHHFSPLAIVLDYRHAVRSLAGISSSQLIQLNVDGQRIPVLVRERQYHPITGNLLHVDFLAVSMTEAIRALVPVELEGEAPAVKNFGGVLVTGLEEIEVECLPKDLPEKIVVDLSKLERIGEAIHVKDLALPEGVEVLNDGDELVVLIAAPEGEEVEGEPGEEFEPEVIEKGKKEKEEF